MITLITLPPYPDDAVCVCGHPAGHHDAGECWTDADGNETWDDTTCPCAWFEVRP